MKRKLLKLAAFLIISPIISWLTIGFIQWNLWWPLGIHNWLPIERFFLLFAGTISLAIASAFIFLAT